MQRCKLKWNLHSGDTPRTRKSVPGMEMSPQQRKLQSAKMQIKVEPPLRGHPRTRKSVPRMEMCPLIEVTVKCKPPFRGHPQNPEMWPRMWPKLGSQSQHCMWVEFVVGSSPCSDFPQVIWLSLVLENPTFPNF